MDCLGAGCHNRLGAGDGSFEQSAHARFSIPTSATFHFGPFGAALVFGLRSGQGIGGDSFSLRLARVSQRRCQMVDKAQFGGGYRSRLAPPVSMDREVKPSVVTPASGIRGLEIKSDQSPEQAGAFSAH